jgi:NADH:ubiquinone oxidoreductase subunit 4 (subunit M)
MIKLLVLVLVPLFSSNLIQLIVCVRAALVLRGLIGATHGLLCFNFDFVSKVLIFLSLYLLILMYYSTHPLPNTKLVNVFVGLTLILVVLFRVNRVIYFYFCFELGLIPIALIILGWGHQPERLVATLYILFYTFSTSFPFLVIILALSSRY